MADDEVSKFIAKRLGTYPSSSSNTEDNMGPIIATGIGILDEIQQHAVRLGSLVDISGVSMSGKTQLLHAITAHILLKHPGGTRPSVCWFDLNRGLDPNRLRHLMRSKRCKSPSASSDAHIDGLHGLSVYYPFSTIAMCSSLHALLDFISTEEGEGVNTVVIDSLGSFHYIDKYAFEKRATHTQVTKQSHELVLCKVLEMLLSTRKVAVFVSKSCLFDETKLDVSWPFPHAGEPSIPRDFMPDLWKKITTHMVLMYHIEISKDTEGDCKRGIIAMKRTEPLRPLIRKAVVTAAAVAVIDDEGIRVESMHAVV
ncbi:unnamed protein product [Agarophyton chilense]